MMQIFNDYSRYSSESGFIILVDWSDYFGYNKSLPKSGIIIFQ